MIRLNSDPVRAACRVGPKCACLDGVRDDRLPASGAIFAGVKALCLEGVGDFTGNAYSNLPTSIGVTIPMTHRAQGG